MAQTLYSILRIELSSPKFENRPFTCRDCYSLPGVDKFSKSDVTRNLVAIERHGFIERLPDLDETGLIQFCAKERPKKFSVTASQLLQDILIGSKGAYAALTQWDPNWTTRST